MKLIKGEKQVKLSSTSQEFELNMSQIDTVLENLHKIDNFKIQDSAINHCLQNSIKIKKSHII